MHELHPLAIHVPIALILIWPIVDAVGLVIGSRDVCRTALGLAALALPASLFATVTGQAAFDAAIAAGIDPDLLTNHSDKADLVPWFLVGILVVRILGPRRLGNKGHALAIGMGVGLIALIVLVGMSGGDLVFLHGIGVKRP